MARAKFFIIDGHGLVYRSFFAYKNNPLITSNNFNTSAIFGFTNTILELIKRESPEYLAVAFDTKEKTWRHVECEKYKATRPKQPLEITNSFKYIYEILEALKINKFCLEGYEADDIIGTMTKLIPEDIDVYIMTSDKDYGQLVKENVFLYKPKNKSYEIFRVDDVLKRWDISNTEQVKDILAMVGDKCDNIDGIAGIGEKTASKLLRKYGDLETIIENINALDFRVREKFLKGIDNVKKSKKLVTIITNCCIDFDFKKCRVINFDELLLQKIFNKLEFHSLIKKIVFNKSNGLF